ncbi:MAG TPA: serine/threonine-protein kinase, partial [Kofleriaceae bacterium]|nr:serine/threonine-protein kinase [Kofleriaceae bacterium]
MDPCLDERRAGEFVAGHIPSAQRDSIEDHVDECGACRQLLAALIRERPSEAGPGPEVRGWEGQQVGRYIVRERIGRGGMGEVFRADDRELGRAIALKRLDPGFDRELLLREARAAAQLSHPNVVTVHEVGEADGAPFLAMELVDGTTLTRWLRDEPRTWRAIASVLAQAGRGLAAAHTRGLVHRDFKPDNVLVDRTGRARVADFGLARAAQPGHRGESQRDAILAAATAATVLAGGTPHTLGSPATALAGTPAYLAPELLDGAAPDARSDQYAFGVAAFEALYGQHPFAGATAEAMWAAMAAGTIKAIRGKQGRGNVPAWLDRHVRRALAVDPAERWDSVAALAEAIERGPRRRWPWVAGAVVAANIALAAFLLQPAHDRCDARLVDRVWTSEARVLDALRLRSAAPARGETVSSAVRLVDDWSSAWRLGAEAACRGEPAVRAAQLGCLDHDLA